MEENDEKKNEIKKRLDKEALCERLKVIVGNTVSSSLIKLGFP